jgi:hypothetical protein
LKIEFLKSLTNTILEKYHTYNIFKKGRKYYTSKHALRERERERHTTQSNPNLCTLIAPKRRGGPH